MRIIYKFEPKKDYKTVQIRVYSALDSLIEGDNLWRRYLSGGNEIQYDTIIEKFRLTGDFNKTIATQIPYGDKLLIVEYNSKKSDELKVTSSKLSEKQIRDVLSNLS